MNLNLRTPWDVVSQYGHSALRLLKIAHGSQAELGRNTANMEAFPVGADGYVALVTRNEYLAIDIFRLLSSSIIMFQSMLDAAMADSLRLDSRLSGVSPDDPFRDQWEKTLTKFGKDTESFEKYHADIYKRFWVPLTHLTPNGLGPLKDFDIATVHQGLANGWNAYTLLSQGIGKPLEQNSWATTCALHDLPKSM